MSLPALDRPRVLVVAGPDRTAALFSQFALDPLVTWEMHTAESFAHARYCLQHSSYALLIAGHDMMQREGSPSLAWLTGQSGVPVLFLGDQDAETYAHAYQSGVSACLPWAMALNHASLLHAVMRQTVAPWQTKILHDQTFEQLAESRRHVDRLVQMIWRSTRHDDRWYSQRHMLERLHEEILRCQRHQAPLSVAIGQLDASAVETSLPDWAADAIVRGKRRSDIVGQYGPNGFLLLMMHTLKPGGVTCCQRLKSRLEEPRRDLSGPQTRVRSYFGVASIGERQNTPQALLRIAEENLETARHCVDSQIVAL